MADAMRLSDAGSMRTSDSGAMEELKLSMGSIHYRRTISQQLGVGRAAAYRSQHTPGTKDAAICDEWSRTCGFF
jgi:hypothetical protein